MQISEQHLTEFIELYKKHFGVVLERSVALEKGLKLCRLIELVEFRSNESDKK